MLDIEEIKNVPYVPTSHPFVERVIGTTRREFLDQTLFFNKRNLQNKLDDFKQYYNETCGYSALASNTPQSIADGSIAGKKGRLPVVCETLYRPRNNNLADLAIFLQKCKTLKMRLIIELLIHFLCTLFSLLKPGGVKVVMAENLAMKQQLIVMSRKKNRSPKLNTIDRFFFGFIHFFVSTQRMRKIAVILKPATILRFHKALCQRKYTRLYSNKTKKKPGRKGPETEVIELILEMRTKNPRIGYGRLSMQVYQVFGIKISRFAVGRIVRQYFKNNPGNNDGPSWLTFIGHMKDSLWSVDLFRCESITLKSHWVMVVMDQFSRRIIGFAVHAGDCDGAAYCRMFNRIISGKDLPKYLSTDNDPIYLFHRWQANLRVLDIEEIKSVPRTPTSHPFIERVIRTTRNECLDQMLFFNQYDLQNKLNQYQEYYNNTRSHSSLAMNTPKEAAANENVDKKVLPIDNYRWQSYCRELYNFPVAA